jgi:DNA-binding winged helix-turn-helix (wHTH) protein/Flp pilus assembly protein TadD
MGDASYRFGPFTADRVGYQVLRDGRPLELTPKLLDLLFHLLDHSASLVTKEALLDALWPDANVTENALAQAMSELREALGDEAGAPTFIKTVARRGYRFIAPVTKLDGGESSRARSADGAAEPNAEERTIAVMDFANVTSDADSAWLGAGIAETVTGDLRALGHFRVIDRRRVTEAARRTSGSLEDVSATLGAQLAVVGSFQRLGDRIRITARVVDVVSGEALADAKVDGPLDGLFALQDQVVAQFSKELGVPDARPGRSSAGRETPSLDVYRAVSEGLVRLESLDVRLITQAIADFERAAAADPRYALAYSGLASAEYAFYETTRSDNAPAHDTLQQAERHARQAVELDEGLAEAHATLALVLVSAGKTEEARHAARRAVALEPSNWRHQFRLGHASWGEPRVRALTSTLGLYPDFAFAHFQIAMVHVARGRLVDAETVLRQGAAVQDRQLGRGGRYPALGLHWLLGLVRLAQDDLDEAIRELDREGTLAEPHRLYGREYAMYAFSGRGAALLRVGRGGEAINAFERALELYPDHASTLLGLAQARRNSGSRAAADAALARADAALATLERTRPVEAGLVRAQALAARGDVDGALSALNRVLRDAPPGFAAWTLPVEPFLKQLHGTQGFRVVLGHLAERAR